MPVRRLAIEGAVVPRAEQQVAHLLVDRGDRLRALQRLGRFPRLVEELERLVVREQALPRCRAARRA